MNRRAFFISIVLTVFAAAMLSGIFTIYKGLKNTATQTAQVTSPVLAAPAGTNQQSVQPTTTQVTPTDAAIIAARYLGQQDVYSVEAAVMDYMNVYKVTFSSGNIVYVSLDGQIISVQFNNGSASALHSQPNLLPLISTEHQNESGEND
jgi:hypothetical protein